MIIVAGYALRKTPAERDASGRDPGGKRDRRTWPMAVRCAGTRLPGRMFTVKGLGELALAT